MMTIDILYFEGCPNIEAALRNVNSALESVSSEADLGIVDSCAATWVSVVAKSAKVAPVSTPLRVTRENRAVGSMWDRVHHGSMMPPNGAGWR
jgi:hypothetical protein